MATTLTDLDLYNHPDFRLACLKTHFIIESLKSKLGMSDEEAIGWVRAWAANHSCEGD